VAAGIEVGEEESVGLVWTAGVGDGEGTEVGVLAGVAVTCSVRGGGGGGGANLPWLLDELEQAAMANMTSSAEVNRTIGLRQSGSPSEIVDPRFNLRKLQLALSTHQRARDPQRNYFVAS